MRRPPRSKVHLPVTLTRHGRVYEGTYVVAGRDRMIVYYLDQQIETHLGPRDPAVFARVLLGELLTKAERQMEAGFKTNPAIAKGE